MRSHQQTIVENQKLFASLNEKKSREFYELNNTYGNYEEAKSAKEQEREKNILDFKVQNLRQNDSNS